MSHHPCIFQNAAYTEGSEYGLCPHKQIHKQVKTSGNQDGVKSFPSLISKSRLDLPEIFPAQRPKLPGDLFLCMKHADIFPVPILAKTAVHQVHHPVYGFFRCFICFKIVFLYTKRRINAVNNGKGQQYEKQHRHCPVIQKSGCPVLPHCLCPEKFRHQGNGNADGHQGLEHPSHLSHQSQNAPAVMPSGNPLLCLVNPGVRAHGVVHLPGFLRHRPLNVFQHRILQHIQKLPPEIHHSSAQEVQSHQQQRHPEQMRHASARVRQFRENPGGKQDADVGIGSLHHCLQQCQRENARRFFCQVDNGPFHLL